MNHQRRCLANDIQTRGQGNTFARMFRSAGINLSFFGLGVQMKDISPITDIETALQRMLSTLKEKGMRLLITVDEATNTPWVREFASAYQILLRNDLPVFLLMTGLYENIGELQDEKNLTFLYRAPKMEMAPLNIGAMARNYKIRLNFDYPRKFSKYRAGHFCPALPKCCFLLHVTLFVKGVGLSVNDVGFVLRIPSTIDTVPTAVFGFMPVVMNRVIPSTVASEPPALLCTALPLCLALAVPGPGLGQIVTVDVLIHYHIAFCIEVVILSVDLLPALLCIPAGGITEPVAFGVMLPGTLRLIGLGTVGIVPYTISPLFSLITHISRYC